MFDFADKNKDGELSYKEFLIMINPPAPPVQPKPHISEFLMQPEVVLPNPQQTSEVRIDIDPPVAVSLEVEAELGTKTVKIVSDKPAGVSSLQLDDFINLIRMSRATVLLFLNKKIQVTLKQHPQR